MATETAESLRVTHLIARDFKRIESVDVSPGSKTLILYTGPNEQGKTSALDALVSALGGKSLSPDMPVRRGADDSRVEVTIGGDTPKYRIVRDWSADGQSTLKVYDVSGDGEPERMPGPQTLLDKLISDISFNPLSFASAKPAEQMEMLLSAAGLRAEFEKAQRRKQSLRDNRTELNRKAAELAGKLKGRAALPEKIPDIISADDIAKGVEEINAHNTAIAQGELQLIQIAESRKQLTADCEEEAGRIHRMNDQLNSEIAALQKRVVENEEALIELAHDRDKMLAAHDRNTEAHKKALAELGERKDASAVRAKLEEARAHNAAVESHTETKKLKDEATSVGKQIEAVQVGIENIDAEMAELLEGSSIGKNVPGLAIVDGAILHNNVPFSQASGMRKLELSALIGMAAAPALKIMVVDEADKLDDVSLARLEAMAAERKYQFWMTATRVTAQGDGFMVLPVRDGKIETVAGPEKAERRNRGLRESDAEHTPAER